MTEPGTWCIAVMAPLYAGKCIDCVAEERDRLRHAYEALRVQTKAVCKAIEAGVEQGRYLALMARSMRNYLADDRRAMNGDA